jgi:hypothetical protein
MRLIGLALILALRTLSKRMPTCLVLGGCSLWTPQKPTELSGITQQLLIRSLERALAQLDIEQLKRARNAGLISASPVASVRAPNQSFKEPLTAIASAPRAC